MKLTKRNSYGLFCRADVEKCAADIVMALAYFGMGEDTMSMHTDVFWRTFGCRYRYHNIDRDDFNILVTQCHKERVGHWKVHVDFPTISIS